MVRVIQRLKDKYSLHKELKQMELERFYDLKFAQENWKNYSTKEKLEFVQKSFDQLNLYYSKKLGLNPNDTKFGFCTGIRALGTHESLTNSIAMPIFAVGYLLSPKNIDKILRHELRHREQYVVGTHLSKAKYYSDKIGPTYLHGATPIERDADYSAYIGMRNVFLTGLLKSSDKVYAAKQLFTAEKKLIRNRFYHLSCSIAYATHGKIVLDKVNRNNIKAISQTRPQQRISETGRFFCSLGQIERLIDRFPDKFDTLQHYRSDGCKWIQNYRQSTLPFHFPSSFFGHFINGQRDCFVQRKDYQEKGKLITEHFYDRYGKDGNLIDKDDIYYSYSGYVPQEIKEAREKELGRDENKFETKHYSDEKSYAHYLERENPSKGNEPIFLKQEELAEVVLQERENEIEDGIKSQSVYHLQQMEGNYPGQSDELQQEMGDDKN